MNPTGDGSREGSAGETGSLRDRAGEAGAGLRQGRKGQPKAITRRAPYKGTPELLGSCHMQLAEQT